MMRAFTVAEIAAAIGSATAVSQAPIHAVSTDSRTLTGGELFVALRGEHFDGHAFLDGASAAGAVAAVVDTVTAGADLPQLSVPDTLLAYGQIAALNRAAFRGPLVGITGSSGKTSVKALTAAVLAMKGPTLATEANYNNEVGVPLTLLRLSPEFELAVVEMGAGKLGDIRYLSDLARPTVAILVNAMPAHLDGMGSLEGVVQTKGEIFDALGAGDYAVINADQPWAEQWRQRAHPAQILDFGLEADAAVRASDIDVQGVIGSRFTLHTPVGSTPVTLHLPGRHSVANALAAAAAGVACGVPLADIAAGLARVRPVAGRLAARSGRDGAAIIDDCYNANPGSVMAAIDVLAGSPVGAGAGSRTLILGSMLELAENSAQLHAEVGEYARQAGIDALWGLGEAVQPAVAAFGAAGRNFADRDDLLAAVQGSFVSGDTVLVKGSRGAAMEAILAALLPPDGGEG